MLLFGFQPSRRESRDAKIGEFIYGPIKGTSVEDGWNTRAKKTSDEQMLDSNLLNLPKEIHLEILHLPPDSGGSPAFRLQKMEVVEAWRGRNRSRR